MDIFNFGHCRHGYYIKLYNLLSDDEIAEKLGITYNQYKKILKKYNAYYSEKCDEYFFSDRSDALECINYLDEKYGLIIKLIE